MSKYGMTREDYELFKSKAQIDPPEHWVSYGWNSNFDDEVEIKHFPNDLVARAYFASIQENNYYKLEGIN
jgi:hypothetical protein